MQTTDVIIIGAGPIGIELAAQLKRTQIDYIHLEAEQIGHTISQWPRHAQFFSAPERVALAGVPVHSPNQQSLTGEMYLSYLRSLVELLGLDIRTYEPVRKIIRTDESKFHVYTETLSGSQHYCCCRIVLATGNMSMPRRLDIPGEELAHIHHRLIDPHRYFRKRLMVIGGKNSALEAALRCWRAGAKVAMSYRRAEFEESIVKPHLAREIGLLIDKGMIDFYPQTVPTRIAAGWIELRPTETAAAEKVPVDFVLVCVGYAMEFSLLRQLGVNLQGEEQIPQYNEETMETNVPNVYLAGTAAGGMQRRHELFIITSHEHVEKIAEALTGKIAEETGSPIQRRYKTSLREVQAD